MERGHCGTLKNHQQASKLRTLTIKLITSRLYHLLSQTCTLQSQIGVHHEHGRKRKSISVAEKCFPFFFKRNEKRRED